jgi:uncharacterized protein YkwD
MPPLLLAVLLAVSKGTLIPAEGAPPPATLTYLRAQLLATLNQHRAEESLPPLLVDLKAQEAAQAHSEEMERLAKLRHDDSEGHTPMQRYAELGGLAQTYGENLGFASRGVVDRDLLWDDIVELDRRMMDERPPQDGHRRNILSKRYQAVGIGVAIGPHGVFFTEDFVGYPEAQIKG